MKPKIDPRGTQHKIDIFSKAEFQDVYSMKSFLHTFILALFAVEMYSAPLSVRAKIRQTDLLSVEVHLAREMYYEKEAITLRAEVCNRGNEATLLHLFSLPYTSFKALIQDEEGLIPRLKVEWFLRGITWTAEDKQIYLSQENDYTRYIKLMSGDCFSSEVDLNDLYELEVGKRYLVKSYFYPNFLYNDKNFVISRNQSSFSIAKGKNPFDAAASRKALSEDKKIAHIKPEDIIFLYLKAVLEKKTENAIRFIDLNSFIQAYENYRKRYEAVNRFEKQRAIDDFRNFLSRDRKDYLMDFRILRTEYSRRDRESAFVHVNIKRYGGAIPIFFQYIYQLKKAKNGSIPWKIVNLKVIRKQEMEFSSIQ